MTDLKCSVTSCAYNDSLLCSLNKIKVGGRSAYEKSETTCDSFHKESSAPMNSMHTGESRIETEVRCEAVECKYNDERVCSASHIYVQGNGGTTNSTRCDTFELGAQR